MSLIFPSKKYEKVVLLTKEYAAQCQILNGFETDKNELEIVPMNVSSIIPIVDFINNQTDLILPKNTRMHFSINSNEYFLIEEEPQIRNITVTMNHKRELTQLKKEGKLDLYNVPEILKDEKNFNKVAKIRFRLSLPYMMYLICLKQNTNGIWEYRHMYIFSSITPFSSIKDTFIRTPLSNINKESNVCIGTIGISNDKTIEGKINSILWSFWNNDFNSDYSDGFEKYLNNNNKHFIRGWFSWAYFTKNKPDFILTENWERYEENHLEKILKKFKASGDSRLLIENPFSQKFVKTNFESGVFIKSNKTTIPIQNLVFSINQEITLDEEDLIFYQILNKEYKTYLTFINKQGAVTLPKELDEDLTNKIYKSLLDNGCKNEFDEYLFKGINLQKNKLYKINVLNGESVIIKLEKIRNLFGGMVELICNGGKISMLISSISSIELFDFDGIKDSNGELIEYGETCVIIKKSTNYPRLYELINNIKYYESEFKNGYIKFIFTDPNGNYHQEDISFTNKDIDENKIILLKVKNFNESWNVVPLYHDFGQIIYSNDDNKSIYTNGNIFAIDLNKIRHRKSCFCADSEYINKCDELEEFLIPGRYEPIQFKIGNSYIIPDWSEPETVFNPKIVKKFNFDKRKGFVSVVVEDSITKIEKSMPFIDAHRNIILNLGWEYTTKYAEIEVGNVYKFKNLRKYVGFNSKTQKALKAIVMICGRPLGLFHDLSTLFLDEAIENNNISLVKKNVHLSETMYNIPELQNGDFFLFKNSSEEITMLGFKATNYDFDLITETIFNSYRIGITMSNLNRRIFFGIPSPRLSSKRSIIGNRNEYVIPNIHGGFEEILYDEMISCHYYSTLRMDSETRNNYIFSLNRNESEEISEEIRENIAA